jgi:phage baseplate assembly protein W
MATQRDRDATNEILGVGWHFPVRVDRASAGAEAIGRASGGIALVRHEQDIEQAIRIILGTRPGERRMRPTFGCRVHELVFAPVNATTFGQISRYVRDALDMWEPRIDVEDVDVTAAPGEAGWIDIDVSYTVRSTKDERSIVYPFYVIGEE